ncbi:hypothetical protein B0F90DRAFT_1827897 [Multifurca ochricompacta]|uniref:Uncharacterized protein n=1 Tax=Multifurca ochricompacta TaxID=376703 RepID=A0AAD4QIF8_9AGAM|nr:hypothetical protein B0F90DRAFT_1827897 [Multifurca ochricompacta]
MDSRGEWTMSWCKGTSIVRADVELFGLAQTMCWTKDFFFGSQPKSIVITSPSSSAILSLKLQDPKRFTADFILFQNSLTSFISSFPGTLLTFIWTPAMTNYCAQTVSVQAAEHCRAQTPLDQLDDHPSPTKWRSLTRLRAFDNWREEWLRARAEHTPTPNHPNQRDKQAYSLSINGPPNSSNHPLWSAAAKRPQAGSTPSRVTPRPLPYGWQTCPCDGTTPATTTHILYDCPLHRESRIASDMHTWLATSTPLMTIFNTKNHVEALLRFLQNSHAAFKPYTAIPPPEPD